jgi:hypothetical protein
VLKGIEAQESCLLIASVIGVARYDREILWRKAELEERFDREF